MAADQYVFMVITWGLENSQRGTFGPFPVQKEDDGHLDDITRWLQRWVGDHPDRSEFSAQLFLTVTADPVEG